MEIKNAIVRAEKICTLLFAIEALKEGRKVAAVNLLRQVIGLSTHELAKATAIACGEEPQGEVGEAAREVGRILKRFL